MLIYYGASVNQTDVNRANALHYAAFTGRVDVCRILLQNGVPFGAPTLAGDTAMDKARAGGHDALAESLESAARLQSEGMVEEARLMVETLEAEMVAHRQAELDEAAVGKGGDGGGGSSGGSRGDGDGALGAF